MAFKRNDKNTKRRKRDDHTPHKRVRAMRSDEAVNVNDTEDLRRFVTDFGKIIPARVTGVTAAQQRRIKKGIRRARNMGLLP